MASNEIPNNFHAALQYDGNGADVIVSRSGAIAGVARLGVGQWQVTLASPIGAAEVSADTAAVISNLVCTVNARRDDDTRWTISAYQLSGGALVLADIGWCFNLFRLPTVN
jgi:hypothetical protein